MRFEVWDGFDAYGLTASDWKKSFPTPAGGKLLFLVRDDGSLQAAQQYAPGGGRVPITDANLAAVKAAYAAMYDTPAPEPGGSDFDQYKAMVGWLFMFVTTGGEG